MLVKMGEIQFSKEILHGNKATAILLLQIGLGLFDVISDVPDVDTLFATN